MKIYLCYYMIKRPKNLYSFVAYNLLPNLNLTQGDFYTGLYGFTKNKKMIKEFKSFHNTKYFIYKEKNIDEDEYKTLCHENSELKINRYSIEKSDKDITLTKHEFDDIDIHYPELINSFLEDLISINPSIFNDEIQLLLYDIGYSIDYTYFYGDEDEIDFISYNLSYNGKESLFELLDTIWSLYSTQQIDDPYYTFILLYIILFNEIINVENLLRIM